MKKKRIVALLIMIVIILGIIPVSASNNDVFSNQDMVKERVKKNIDKLPKDEKEEYLKNKDAVDETLDQSLSMTLNGKAFNFKKDDILKVKDVDGDRFRVLDMFNTKTNQEDGGVLILSYVMIEFEDKTTTTKAETTSLLSSILSLDAMAGSPVNEDEYDGSYSVLCKVEGYYDKQWISSQSQYMSKPTKVVGKVIQIDDPTVEVQWMNLKYACGVGGHELDGTPHFFQQDGDKNFFEPISGRSYTYNITDMPYYIPLEEPQHGIYYSLKASLKRGGSYWSYTFGVHAN